MRASRLPRRRAALRAVSAAPAGARQRVDPRAGVHRAALCSPDRRIRVDAAAPRQDNRRWRSWRRSAARSAILRAPRAGRAGRGPPSRSDRAGPRRARRGGRPRRRGSGRAPQTSWRCAARRRARRPIVDRGRTRSEIGASAPLDHDVGRKRDDGDGDDKRAVSRRGQPAKPPAAARASDASAPRRGRHATRAGSRHARGGAGRRRQSRRHASAAGGEAGSTAANDIRVSRDQSRRDFGSSS